MPTFAVILPAAGKSSRFRMQQRKKPFIDLKGRPVWVRSAEHFVNRDDVVQTLVVVAPDDLEWFKDKFRPNLAFMDVQIVAGGADRADSVQNALARVKPDVDFVAVHDAARPLLVKKWVDAIFSAAVESGAAIPAVRVSSTLKRGRSESGRECIAETVPREHLWLAQTPQVFRRQLLLDAYAGRGNAPATDEASLVERLGHPVTLVDGSPMNLKITTQDDFRMAEALLNALPKEERRPLHPFHEDRPEFWS